MAGGTLACQGGQPEVYNAEVQRLQYTYQCIATHTGTHTHASPHLVAQHGQGGVHVSNQLHHLAHAVTRPAAQPVSPLAQQRQVPAVDMAEGIAVDGRGKVSALPAAAGPTGREGTHGTEG